MLASRSLGDRLLVSMVSLPHYQVSQTMNPYPGASNELSIEQAGDMASCKAEAGNIGRVPITRMAE